MTSIAVDYRLSLNECMIACSDHWRIRGRGTTRIACIGVAAVLLGIATSFASMWALLLIFVGCLILFFPLVRWVRFRSAFKTRCKDGPLEAKIEFSDSNICATGQNSKTEYSWNSFTQYNVSEIQLFLDKSSNDFYAIPIASIPSDENPRLLEILTPNCNASDNKSLDRSDNKQLRALSSVSLLNRNAALIEADSIDDFAAQFGGPVE